MRDASGTRATGLATFTLRPFDDVTARGELPARVCSVRTAPSAVRPGVWSQAKTALARDAQPTLELLATRPTHTQARPTLELHLVVPARAAVERVDEIDPYDDRAVDAQESLGIEPLLQRVDRFTNQIRPLARVQLHVRATRGDVLDLGDGHHAHLASHLHGDSLEIR